MTGHMSWEPTPVTRETLKEMVAYHQGYILAIQDLLDDYGRMMRSGTYTRERFVAEMKSSLRQAQRSLGRVVSEQENE